MLNPRRICSLFFNDLTNAPQIMKCIKIPVQATNRPAEPYKIQIGSVIRTHTNFRSARSDAEAIGEELTLALIEVNQLYIEYLIHYRKCWLLEAPFTDKMSKSMPGIELYLNMATGGHNLSHPVKNMRECLSTMSEFFALMKNFYRQRNHHSYVAEIKTIENRIHQLDTQIGIYSRNIDTFLFSKRV
jgi:hypothetical protein